MKKILFFDESLTDAGYSLLLLFLRLFIGIMMLTHGWAKIENFQQLSLTFLDPIGLGSQPALILAILAEVGCSLLLIFGIFTRLAVLPLMATMLVAIFIAHAADSFAAKELPIMYLAVYVILFFTGSGRIAISHTLMNRLFRSSRSIY